MTTLDKGIFDLPVLQEYYRSTENINRLYNYKREQLTDEWIDFNTDIAKSLVYLYSYFICLDKEVQDKFSNKEEKIISSRYLSFYYDFIVSKPSNTIFTETQKKSLKDPYPLNAVGISKIAKELYVYVNNAPTQFNLIVDQHFNALLHKLFHKAFSFYEFIFSGNEGVFAKFEYNHILFDRIASFYQKSIENLGSSIKLRDLCSKAIVVNIEMAISKQAPSNLNAISYKEVYTKYVELSKNKNDVAKLEIFTYILANKLWKVDKIFQNSLEDPLNNENKQIQYLEKLTKYIDQYLSVIRQFYDKIITERTLYVEVAKLDRDFIHEYILEKFLKDIEESPLNTIEDISSTNSQSFRNYVVENGLNTVSYINKYAINNREHERFKFYRVIAKAKDWNEISIFIDLMHAKIKSQYSPDDFEKIHYMGILRSGSFLAHALNILKMNGKNTQISESMLNHPYLTIIPRHLFDRESNNDHIVVYIDEAIKTGYGVTISHLYRKKMLQKYGYNVNTKDSIFVIANFDDYKEKINLKIDSIKCSQYSNGIVPSSLKYNYLLNCYRDERKGNGHELICPSSQQVKLSESDQIFDWLTYLKKLKINETDDRSQKEMLKEKVLTYAKAGDNIYDFTKVISNSLLLFIICKYFAKKLYDDYYSKSKLVFYAGSIEGKLLIDITVFVYKVLYGEKSKDQTFYINGKTFSAETDEDTALLFFDLTYMSGATCKKIFDLDVHKNSKKNKTDFDVIFVLFSQKSEIISVCYQEDIKRVSE